MAAIAIIASVINRAARGTARALAAAATSRGRSSRLRWFASTGAIAIAAIATLRCALKAVATSTAATATSGASVPFGLRITETAVTAKKTITMTKYFRSMLPAGAIVTEAISGLQSTIVAPVIGFAIEWISVYQLSRAGGIRTVSNVD